MVELAPGESTTTPLMNAPGLGDDPMMFLVGVTYTVTVVDMMQGTPDSGICMVISRHGSLDAQGMPADPIQDMIPCVAVASGG